jgi:hypothetical protein
MVPNLSNRARSRSRFSIQASWLDSNNIITGAYKYSAVHFAVVVFIIDNENR